MQAVRSTPVGNLHYIFPSSRMSVLEKDVFGNNLSSMASLLPPDSQSGVSRNSIPQISINFVIVLNQ